MATDGGPEQAGRRWEERFADAGGRVEEELRRAVRFLDEEVVPEVRLNSSTALRAAAERLRQLAERLDDERRRGGGR